MVTKQLDVVEDAILQAYQTNLNTRRRVRINVDRFLNITLIELTLGQVDTKGYKYKARIFRGQVETYAHWLTQEERCPIIAKMFTRTFATCAATPRLSRISSSVLARHPPSRAPVVPRRSTPPSCTKPCVRLSSFLVNPTPSFHPLPQE
jgi:hypothetical protein